MKTPIFDFVKRYADSEVSRFHMPGHKGRGDLGFEALDVTEISGADVLYSADGIIAESENNATALFDTAHTYYSTEGSTLAIKAMLAIAVNNRESDTPPVILAARNVHKAFVNAAALLDLSVEWLYPTGIDHLCACPISAASVDSALSRSQGVCAVYITSPDYLGNIADVRGISEVCDRHGVPLLVDNAHGAYLAFLDPSQHPIALGAAMCADSAHKTLPTLTGGAYLHVSKKYAHYTEGARNILSVFASTSPSYLILESLDLTNKYLFEGYSDKLRECVERVKRIKRESLIPIERSEPLKIVFKSARFGYSGTQLAELLRSKGVEPEFADETYTVLMVTPSNTEADFVRLERALSSVPSRAPIFDAECIPLDVCVQVIPIRTAVFSRHEIVPIESAVGRIAGAPTVSCPPAVPIVISGERITENTVELFKQYGITEIEVVI